MNTWNVVHRSWSTVTMSDGEKVVFALDAVTHIKYEMVGAGRTVVYAGDVVIARLDGDKIAEILDLKSKP